MKAPLKNHETPPYLWVRDDVLAELAELRRREGIDVRKVRESAPTIMQLLPVERSKLERSVPPEVAAYEYLRCIAGRAKDLGHEYQRVVWATLNFDGEPTLLTQRRNMLRGYRKESAYLEYEKTAFENYAGQLLWRQSSPCEDETADVDHRAWASALLTTSYDEDAIDFMILALRKLRRTRTDEEAREYGRRLFEELPVGLEFVGVTRESNPEAVLDAGQILFAAAEPFAVLRAGMQDQRSATRAEADVLGISFETWKARHYLEKLPIFARTILWLEHSKSWGRMFEFVTTKDGTRKLVSIL